MKTLCLLAVLIPSAVSAQILCDVGGPGPFPEECITDVPPVPAKHHTMPPYAKPISVVAEPTTASVIEEPVVSLKKSHSRLSKKVSKLEKRLKRLERNRR